MKKGLFFGIIMFILCMNFAVALNSASYQIFEGKVLVEINFDNADDVEIKIPAGSSALEVNTEDFETIDLESYKIIKIKSARNASIKYISSSYIDKSGSNYFFIAKDLGDFSNVLLYLPEGALLSEFENYLIVPKPSDVDSDGRRVILSWNNFNSEEIVVSYEFAQKNNYALYFVLAILFAAFTKYLYNKIKNKKIKKKLIRRKIFNKILTTNLYGDEKKIVEYLAEKKGRESWTKEIVRDLQISKVKLSRKLRNLEQLELIKRIPYGNENRIKLLKK